MNDYNSFVKELIIDAKNFTDSECLNLSSKRESEYIRIHSPRIKSTIDYFNYFLDEKNKQGQKCKILDIGTTPFTFLYSKYLGAEISSIDLTNLLERRCKLNNVIFKKCNLLEEDIPFENKKFDIIIFTEVFEHLIGPPKLIFERIKKVLKADGIIVFSTPNIASNYLKLKLLLGKPILEPVYTVFHEDIHGNWIHGSGHWRKFTMRELKDILTMYQFKIIKSKHILKPFIDIRTKSPRKFIRRLALKILFMVLPASQFNLIIASNK